MLNQAELPRETILNAMKEHGGFVCAFTITY